jgi:hypothetical protein
MTPTQRKRALMKCLSGLVLIATQEARKDGLKGIHAAQWVAQRIVESQGYRVTFRGSNRIIVTGEYRKP